MKITVLIRAVFTSYLLYYHHILYYAIQLLTNSCKNATIHNLFLFARHTAVKHRRILAFCGIKLLYHHVFKPQ